MLKKTEAQLAKRREHYRNNRVANRAKQRAYKAEFNKRCLAAGLCIDCAKNKIVRNKRCEDCCRKCDEKSRKHRKKIRSKILYHYGHVCTWCGENDTNSLSIDHVNNDGHEHRKQVLSGGPMYTWLIKNNFPPGFQLLCMNCNATKAWFGGGQLLPCRKNKYALVTESPAYKENANLLDPCSV